MATIINRPAADPLDDIDRESSGADTSMARQDRADLPGERSDQPGNQNEPGDVFIEATREVSRQDLDPEQERIDGDREAERIADGDPDLAPLEVARGADDDDPIDEVERAGDDSIT
jgi:hypothetical protein